METLKGLAEEYAQRDDLYTENGEYTKTTVINAFNDGAKAMLQVIGFSLAAHRHKETKVTTKKEREWLIEQINKTNMDIKELRIGNYVKYNGCVVSVYAISNPMPNSNNNFNNKGRVTLWCNGLIAANIDEIEPIPITEELLLKNGFKKGWNGYFDYRECNDELSIRFCENYTYIEYANLCFNPEDVTETNYGSSLEFPNTLHLHTLQNIWYLLTGKELEIKL